MSKISPEDNFDDDMEYKGDYGSFTEEINFPGEDRSDYSDSRIYAASVSSPEKEQSVVKFDMTPTSDSVFEDSWNIIFHFTYDHSKDQYDIEPKELERLCDLLNQNTPYMPDAEEPIQTHQYQEQDEKKNNFEAETQEGTNTNQDVSE